MRPGYGTPTAPRRPAGRRWPSSESRERLQEIADQTRASDAARAAEHLAQHGPHTCTPDPADPWSTCHLDSPKETR